MTDATEREGTPRIGSKMRPSDERIDILLVDDRPDKLLALEAILAGLGQNLILAHSGAEALRTLLRQEVALIVLDVSMPGMDGFETASLIRQRPNSELTPIIFISAINYADTHLARGYSLGAIDYILAPIVPEILRAKVSFFVELYKKTQQLKHQAETEAQLLREQAARTQAEAANRAKDRFLAMLSHELRTPLTPILFSSSMLGADLTIPEHIREEFQSIARNAELEARLIDDLLDISRFTQGKLTLTSGTADAHGLLRSTLDICSKEISAKNLHFDIELGAIQHCIQADVARLQQVFWNLVKNAIKFSPPQGRVVLRSSNPRTGWFRLEVIDSGVGIAPEVLPRIFDAFHQAGAANFGGLGLGLAICKAIIESHEGEIFASSPGEGHGTTLVIQLPRVIPQLEG